MACYHLHMYNGKSSGAITNLAYNFGKEKYSYKQDEIAYSQHNMPKWANSPQEFWEKYTLHDRANSSYKKIELSLQNELSLEENQELLNEFIKKNIGDSYYYSAVIHDKESSIDGVKNIHAHIMICKRKVDEIERTPEHFFSKANSKHLEKGGAIVDNEYWGKKQTLLNIRKNWEISINNAFKKKNLNIEVSCESLETQKKKALEKQNMILAECLDRPPVSLEGYLFKKKDNLTQIEKEKIEQYNDAKELRDLKKEVYLLRQEIMERELLKEQHKKEEEVLFEEKIFNTIYEIQNSIFKVALEKHSIQEQLSNTESIRLNALTIVSEEYLNLTMQLKKLYKNEAENIQEILNVEVRMREIEESVTDKELEKNISIIISQMQKEIDTLTQREIFLYEEMENQMEALENENIEEYYQNYQYKNWENFYTTLQEKRQEAYLQRKKINKISKKLSPDNLEFSVYNSLTKGKYGKTMKKMNGIIKQLENKSLSFKETKKLETELKKTKAEITTIKNKYRYAKGKSIYIQREHWIKNKYKESFSQSKQKLDKINLEINFLKEKMMDIPVEKQKEFKAAFRKKLKKEGYKKLIIQKNTLLRQQKNLEHKMQVHNLNNQIYDVMTNKKSTELLKKYNELDLLLQYDLEFDVKEVIIVELEETSKEYNRLIGALDQNIVSGVRTMLFANLNENLNEIKKELNEINADIKAMDSLGKETVSGGGSIKAIKNFNKKYVNQELGKILNTGSVKILFDDEDKLDKQMKKELDFSR